MLIINFLSLAPKNNETDKIVGLGVISNSVSGWLVELLGVEMVVIVEIHESIFMILIKEQV